LVEIERLHGEIEHLRRLHRILTDQFVRDQVEALIKELEARIERLGDGNRA
jgi:hypothetical protein